MTEFDDWITTAEAAEILGISEQSVRDRVLSQLSIWLGEKRRVGHPDRGRWMIRAAALDSVVIRPQGRPKKSL